MREGWKEVKLGDILEIKHGYGFKGEFFKEYETDNVLVTPGNFNIGGGFKNEKLKYYDGPISEDFILKPNDVIVTMTDLSKMADTIGYSAKVPSSSKTYLHNQRIGLIKLLTDEVDIDFIYWFLRTSNYQRYVAGSSTGATVKHTSPTKIYSYKGIIPPLETQKKIASILSGYDDLIENNLKRIKILEEMAQQTYEEWFVRMRFPGASDFDSAQSSPLNHQKNTTDSVFDGTPVTDGTPATDGTSATDDTSATGCTPAPDDTLATGGTSATDVTSATERSRSLPEGWEKVKLGDLGEIVTGKTPLTSKEEYYNGDIPFIKTPDMNDSVYVIATNQYLTQQGSDVQKNKILYKNDLVISCIGSAGAYALVSKPSQFNQQINAIRFKKNELVFFTFCYAKGLKETLEALGSNGATMTNVNKGKFEQIDIVLPNDELLNKFHQFAKPCFESILNLQSQNQRLREARDILLPRLMMGMV